MEMSATWDHRRDEHRDKQTHIWEGFTRISLKLHLVAKDAVDVSMQIGPRFLDSWLHSLGCGLRAIRLMRGRAVATGRLLN